MATYYGSKCDENILTPECSTCVDSYELSGIGSAAIVHASYYATLLAGISTPSVWQTGYATGKIKIIPNIRGEFDGGTPKMGVGYGRRLNTYVGSEYKGKLFDANYIENSLFWDSVLTTSNWHVAIVTETQVHLSKNVVTFAPGNPIADDIQKVMEWSVDYSFFQTGLMLPYNAPAGIFDCSLFV